MPCAFFCPHPAPHLSRTVRINNSAGCTKTVAHGAPLVAQSCARMTGRGHRAKTARPAEMKAGKSHRIQQKNSGREAQEPSDCLAEKAGKDGAAVFCGGATDGVANYAKSSEKIVCDRAYTFSATHASIRHSAAEDNDDIYIVPHSPQDSRLPKSRNSAAHAVLSRIC